MNPLLTVLLAGGVLALLLVVLMPRGGARTSGKGNEPLVMLVAAGIRTPVETILEQYEQEMGVKVQPQYGGSNMLLNQLKVNKFEQPDLYLAADTYFTEQAVEQGLAAEVFPLARQEPVLAFRKDRARDISAWAELLVDGTRWSLGDPDQAAIGKSIRDALSRLNPEGEPLAAEDSQEKSLWSRLEAQTIQSGVFKPTVNEVANDIKIGAVDVGIVWSSTVASPEYRDDLVAVRIPDLQETASVTGLGDEVSVAVLTTSARPTEAIRLARYLSARDRGLQVFEEAGMSPTEGDVWAVRPEINFFCGAVNRKAIEPVIDDFQKREGVVVNTVFDGCGILTSRMGTIEGQSPRGGFPDVYMACDRYYLDNVQDWFQEDVNVSQTEIVLVVPKGSDKVRSLEDLLKPGVRVSVGEPDQCTIGALTRRLLQNEGLYDRFKEKQGLAGEVVVEKSSSALIVPDVLTGHVDVVVAYRNDVLTHENEVDVISIDSPLTQAIQPLSISRNSDHKQLSRRLYRHVERARSRFEDVGFQFLLPDPAQATRSSGSAQ